MVSTKKTLTAQERARIKHIQFVTRRMLRGLLSGDSVSRQRGYGLDFDQVRTYEQGDDIRCIDWKAVARTDTLMVKQYLHDHTKTVLIALDLSASGAYGSKKDTTFQLLQEAALVLVAAAEAARASIGLLLFADTPLQFIPPRRGARAVHELTDFIAHAQPLSKKTSLARALQHFAQLRRTDTMAFILSDFIAEGFETQLAYVSRSYDIIGVRALDSCAKIVPMNCLVPMEDAETGQHSLVQLNSLVNQALQSRIEQQNKLFARCGVDLLDLMTGDQIIDQLVAFFARRMRYAQ